MKTWTEMEAELELDLRKWAQALDQMEAEEAAKNAEFEAKIKAASADAKAKLQAEQAKMHADFEAKRTKLQQDLEEADHKLDAAVERVDGDMAKAESKVKTDLEAQRARLNATRDKVNAQLKAIYEAQVNHIKGQIAEMQAWARSADEKVNAKVSADLETLRQKATEVEQRIRRTHAENVAAWNEDKARVKRAIADLKEGRDKARADLAQGREKAKAEFKQAA
jgi:hypothetical protein